MDYKYCYKCGSSEIDENKICLKCKTYINEIILEDITHCPECGIIRLEYKKPCLNCNLSFIPIQKIGCAGIFLIGAIIVIFTLSILFTLMPTEMIKETFLSSLGSYLISQYDTFSNEINQKGSGETFFSYVVYFSMIIGIPSLIITFLIKLVEEDKEIKELELQNKANKETREKQQQEYQLEQEKTRQIELESIKSTNYYKVMLKYLDGISYLVVNQSVMLEFTPEKLLIDKTLSVLMERIKITGVFSETEAIEEIKEKNKNVIGRAVVGGVLLGPLGAIIGGMSGMSKKIEKNVEYKIRKFFVINYTNKDNDLSVALFEICCDSDIPFVRQLSDRINQLAKPDKIIEL